NTRHALLKRRVTLRSVSHQDLRDTLPATPELYTLSLHDALPIFEGTAYLAVAAREVERHRRAAHPQRHRDLHGLPDGHAVDDVRSEEHTSELQSRFDAVRRLLPESNKLHRPKARSPLARQSSHRA